MSATLAYVVCVLLFSLKHQRFRCPGIKVEVRYRYILSSWWFIQHEMSYHYITESWFSNLCHNTLMTCNYLKGRVYTKKHQLKWTCVSLYLLARSVVSLNDDLIYVRGREAIYLGHSPFSHTQSLRLNYLLSQWVL